MTGKTKTINTPAPITLEKAKNSLETFYGSSQSQGMLIYVKNTDNSVSVYRIEKRLAAIKQSDIEPPPPARPTAQPTAQTDGAL